MSDYPLIVFATSAVPIPLVAMRDLLVTEGVPANFGVDIAGEATDEQLNEPAWGAAFLRWLEPDVHEVALIDRMPRDTDDQAEECIGRHMTDIARQSDVGGRMIVADYLNRTRTVYAVQLLPALLAEESHDAWGALDILLRFVAHASDGVIYADAEGYCDAEGELLLAEIDELNDVSMDELE